MRHKASSSTRILTYSLRPWSSQTPCSLASRFRWQIPQLGGCRRSGSYRAQGSKLQGTLGDSVRVKGLLGLRVEHRRQTRHNARGVMDSGLLQVPVLLGKPGSNCIVCTNQTSVSFKVFLERLTCKSPL